MIEKTITIFRNKKPKKNLKFGLLGFLGFFKKPKKPRFFKSDFYSPGLESTLLGATTSTIWFKGNPQNLGGIGAGSLFSAENVEYL